MIGFSITPIRRRVDAATCAAFAKLPVANVSDCMSRMTAGGAKLRPMHAEGVLAAPAFTVKTRPGDNLMVHKAIDIAAPGDVVVVDAGGDLTNAIIGEIMMNHAKKRGLAGMVIAPGDLVLGDEDGLLCVPYERAARILAETQKKHAQEVRTLAAIEAGEPTDRSWIDRTLERLGCEMNE